MRLIASLAAFSSWQCLRRCQRSHRDRGFLFSKKGAGLGVGKDGGERLVEFVGEGGGGEFAEQIYPADVFQLGSDLAKFMAILVARAASRGTIS